MLFQPINRTDADRVFVVGKNLTGVALSAGVPVELDVETVTDGHAFTACKSGGNPQLFMGILDRAAAIAEDGLLVQVYGYRSQAWVSQASAAIPIGVGMKAVGGLLLSAYSAGIALGHNYVTLLDTTSAKSAGALDRFAVFIRAM